MALLKDFAMSSLQRSMSS
eukprot:Gb_33553 [translate_table: standard]